MSVQSIIPNLSHGSPVQTRPDNAKVCGSANLKWTMVSNIKRDGDKKQSVHTCGSWVEAEPFALLVVLLLRCSRRLKVAVRLARSTAAGDSRYTRSLCDWLIPGSLRW